MENSAHAEPISSNTTELQPEVPPAVDSVVQVSLSRDELLARIRITPPENGGAPPTGETIYAALKSAGIVYNIDAVLIARLAQEPVYNQDIVIARGLPPVDGTDGTARFLFETEKKGVKLKENEDGSVDFYDLGIVENVKKGQVLCTITLPTPGSPGMTVRGQIITQKVGRPVPSFAGRNTELTEDGTAIVAKIDGPVEFEGRKINVREVFYIDGDVDASTGNVKVASSLTVTGMVLPRFKVEAEENIQIGGNVENATIRAGGNVRLKSGITGSELYCNGDLYCRFIQNCKVVVKGNITAEYILNSDITCGGTLKTMGHISRVVGGRVAVGQVIETGSIGSPATVRTKLELGADSSSFDRQHKLSARIPELEKRIESLKPLLELLRQLEECGRLTPEKQEILENAQFSYTESMKELKAARQEIEEITKRIAESSDCKVICRGTIYPGTVITMGCDTLTLTTSLEKTVLYLKDGIISTARF